MKKVIIESIYKNLSKTYQIFSEKEDDWSGNGLNSTPFKSLVSVMLSTMTNSKKSNPCSSSSFWANIYTRRIIKTWWWSFKRTNKASSSL